MKVESFWGKMWNGINYGVVTWKKHFGGQFGFWFWLLLVLPSLQEKVSVRCRAPKVDYISDAAVFICSSPGWLWTQPHISSAFTTAPPCFSLNAEDRHKPVWYGLLFIHTTCSCVPFLARISARPPGLCLLPSCQQRALQTGSVAGRVLQPCTFCKQNPFSKVLVALPANLAWPLLAKQRGTYSSGLQAVLADICWLHGLCCNKERFNHVMKATFL